MMIHDDIRIDIIFGIRIRIVPERCGARRLQFRWSVPVVLCCKADGDESEEEGKGKKKCRRLSGRRLRKDMKFGVVTNGPRPSTAFVPHLGEAKPETVC